MRISYVEADGLMKIQLVGDLDERAEEPIDQMRSKATAQVLHFDCGGVDRVNSFGVRAWLGFFATLKGRTVEFHRLPMVMIDYGNVLPRFLSFGKVMSFAVPLHCEACDLDEVRVVAVAQAMRDGLAKIPCVKCKKPLELTVKESAYTAFLKPS